MNFGNWFSSAFNPHRIITYRLDLPGQAKKVSSEILKWVQNAGDSIDLMCDNFDDRVYTPRLLKAIVHRIGSAHHIRVRILTLPRFVSEFEEYDLEPRETYSVDKNFLIVDRDSLVTFAREGVDEGYIRAMLQENTGNRGIKLKEEFFRLYSEHRD